MRNQKPVIVAVVIIAALWIGAAAVFSLVKEEPLTADKLLARHDLKADEIVISVSNMNLENADEETRRKVFRHVRDQIDRLPELERDAVREQLSDRRLEKLRQQWRHMTPEQQKEQVEKRLEGMRKRREEMSQEERERIRKRINSPDGQRQVKRAMKNFNEKLTPDERTVLTPLVREIVEQLESL